MVAMWLKPGLVMVVQLVSGCAGSAARRGSEREWDLGNPGTVVRSWNACAKTLGGANVEMAECR